MGYKLTIKALICTSILLVFSCISAVVVYASSNNIVTFKIVYGDTGEPVVGVNVGYVYSYNDDNCWKIASEYDMYRTTNDKGEIYYNTSDLRDAFNLECNHIHNGATYDTEENVLHTLSERYMGYNPYTACSRTIKVWKTRHMLRWKTTNSGTYDGVSTLLRYYNEDNNLVHSINLDDLDGYYIYAGEDIVDVHGSYRKGECIGKVPAENRNEAVHILDGVQYNYGVGYNAYAGVVKTTEYIPSIEMFNIKYYTKPDIATIYNVRENINKSTYKIKYINFDINNVLMDNNVYINGIEDTYCINRDSAKSTYEFKVTKNGEYRIQVEDWAGQKSNILNYTVTNIDEIPPNLEITYDENPTNENIILCVSATDSESGIKEITLPDGSIILEATADYEVAENGEYIFTATDNAGNTATKTITVSNIDKIVPQLEITYDNNPTNENIILCVSATDSESGIKEITLPDGNITSKQSTDYEVTQNGEYIFTATDNAGNITTKTINVSNIDKTAPNLEITYNSNPTNENINFLVSATDSESGVKEITLPDGSIISESTADYEVAENGEYIFTATDNAGNITTKTINVSNIDKTAPNLEITYNSNPTNENITLCVSATDSESGIKEITLPDGSIISEATTDYEVAENGEYIFTVTDNAGNVSTKTITVSNIDTTPPTLEINYDDNPTNENITLSVSAADSESVIKEITLPDGSIILEATTDYEITENGDYTFTVTDNAGNLTTKTVTVSCIDKNLPVIESHKVDYKENKIFVTLESAEENLTYLISETKDIKDLEFKAENTFELASDGTYYAFAKDSVGNISLPYELIASSPKLPQISVDTENGEFEGSINVTITVTSQDTELKSFKYIVTSSADYPLSEDTWIIPDDTTPKTVTISTEGEQYIHVFASDIFGNITTKTFGSYIITPEPIIIESPETNISSGTIVTEPDEDIIETEEVIITQPIETEESFVEAQPPQTEVTTPFITEPENIVSEPIEDTSIEYESKEIPVLVIGNEDKNFILYEEDIEGVETIQVLDDTENKIAEFEPEKIEEIKVNPPTKDGYDFAGYKKTHLETHLVLIPTYKAASGYDDTEAFDILPSPIPEKVVNSVNVDNQSALFIGLVYTIAILAIIVLILSIIALTYKISNLRADRNSR